MRLNTRFLFLNIGHATDHLMMLLFPAVVVVMATEFEGGYSEMLPLATGGFIAFGVFSLPAGWLADRWSREGMIGLFFLGIGSAAIATSFASTDWQIALGLFAIGMFAAIYHPVGIAMVSQGGGAVGKRLGVNGVWGNMGVAASALTAGALADAFGWRAAFLIPGLLVVGIGIAWLIHCRGDAGQRATAAGAAARKSKVEPTADWKRVLVIVAVATAFGGFIFNATTIALPKVFDDRLADLAGTATQAGALIAIVYALAAFSQIVVGSLIDKHPLKWIFVGITLGDVLIFLLAANATGSSMLALALVMMVLVFVQIPITDTLVARHTPEDWRGRVYAVKYVLSFGVASTAAPAIAWLYGGGLAAWPALDGISGFAGLFLICCACAAVVSMAALMLPRPRPAPVPAMAGED